MAAVSKTHRPAALHRPWPAAPVASERAIEAARISENLMQTNTEKYFLHSSVFLRHASEDSGEAEEQIEEILTKAVVAKHRVWISSILFVELRPSMFIPGRFATLFELTRYFRSLATFVTPDPNIMLRAARLRDVKWQRPAGDLPRPRRPALSGKDTRLRWRASIAAFRSRPLEALNDG